VADGYNPSVLKKSSVAVLVSGGLDSAALLCHAATRFRRVYPIFIRQGLRWEKAELYWLGRFLRKVRVEPLVILDVPMKDLYQRHWSVSGANVPGARSADSAVYLPGRNLLLTLKSGIFCAARKIPALWIGSLDHNPFPDATLAFFRAWGKSISQGLGWNLRIEAPFRKKSKAQIISAYAEAPLHVSLSCLAPVGRNHCGRCNKCAERRKAFHEAGIEDKSIYEKK